MPVPRSVPAAVAAWRAAAAACLLSALSACAEAGAGVGRVTTPGQRQAPDDSDLWNLVPAGAEVVADVDLRTLRSSPWSSALMTGDFGGERDARKRMFGFDVFTEADRMLAVGIETAGASRALTIARGTFSADVIGTAFTTATPGAVAGQWRQSPLWEGQSGGMPRAVALVTPRTLAQGDPETVRAAIDAAWGVVPDARTGELGELRRGLGAEPSQGAVVIALTVGEGMRSRAAGFLELPPALRRAAGRLDLGQDLSVDAVAVFDDPRAASAAAAIWADAVRQIARQRIVQFLGFGPILEGLGFRGQGQRVLGQLRIPASKRELLADKLVAVLQMLAAARGSAP